MSPVRSAELRVGLPIADSYVAGHNMTTVAAASLSVREAAELLGRDRTRVYALLEGLSSRGLADLLPGKQAVWASPGREAILDRLLDAKEYVEIVEAAPDLVGRITARIAQCRHTAVMAMRRIRPLRHPWR